MFVQIGDKKFRYSFKHFTQEEDVHYEMLRRKESGGYIPRYYPSAITQVFIEEQRESGDEWVKVPPAGEAFCSELDNFSKETGRKVALTRALKDLFPEDFEVREAFWKNYFDRKPKKWDGDVEPSI